MDPGGNRIRRLVLMPDRVRCLGSGRLSAFLQKMSIAEFADPKAGWGVADLANQLVFMRSRAT